MNASQKDLICTAAIIFLALSCSGCDRPIEKTPGDSWAGKPIVYQDPQTGCQYFVFGTGITARIGADGKPLCKAMKL